MELSILHAIQTIHNPVLDKIMVLVFNNLVGSLGQLWIVVGVVLLLIQLALFLLLRRIGHARRDGKPVRQGNGNRPVPVAGTEQ